MAQRIPSGQAYGDIFLVNTPALDRWGQQLYLEQKTREAKAQEESKLLDANIQKEIGKVRSVDTPEVIKNYQDYKALRKDLLFNKNLQKDPVLFNERQQAAAKKYQDIFTTANKSAELKELAKGLTAGYMKDPNSHADDFGVRVNTLMNTPVSQLSQPHPQYGDLTNMESYLDRSINTDFGKMVKEGIGAEKTIYGKPETMAGGLQIKTPSSQYANTPLQVKDYVLGAMSMRQAGKDAAKSWDKLPEEEIANTIKAYQALPKEHWQKMGLQEPQNLFPKNPDSKAENFASYLSMKDAIARVPREGKPLVETNMKAVKDLEWERNLKMQAIRQADAKSLAKFKKEIDPNDTELNNVWYQTYLDKLIDTAKTSGEKHYLTKGGKVVTYYNMIKPDPFVAKSFMRGKSEPDRIGVTDKGELIPIFFKYKSTKDGGGVETTADGKPVVDTDYSQPMEYDQALVNLGYRGTTKKQLGKDMKAVNSSKSKSPSGVNVDDLRKKYNY